ncbi:hypothetical protein KFE25_003709 [Diacronema lutheri]|uniref:Uncharacterized protein n=1 Tax=Diacronema lutheri TaxID=2081491 RepID=A0A8J5X9N6_DIALT|nr:hypothetical protein KFE25_003709 [Diacronema lutheri]
MSSLDARRAERRRIAAVVCGGGPLRGVSAAERRALVEVGQWVACSGLHLLSATRGPLAIEVADAFARARGRRGLVIAIVPRPDAPDAPPPASAVVAGVPERAELPIVCHLTDPADLAAIGALTADVVVVLPSALRDDRRADPTARAPAAAAAADQVMHQVMPGARSRPASAPDAPVAPEFVSLAREYGRPIVCYAPVTPAHAAFAGVTADGTPAWVDAVSACGGQAGSACTHAPALRGGAGGAGADSAADTPHASRAVAAALSGVAADGMGDGSAAPAAEAVGESPSFDCAAAGFSAVEADSSSAGAHTPLDVVVEAGGALVACSRADARVMAEGAGCVSPRAVRSARPLLPVSALATGAVADGRVHVDVAGAAVAGDCAVDAAAGNTARACSPPAPPPPPPPPLLELVQLPLARSPGALSAALLGDRRPLQLSSALGTLAAAASGLVGGSGGGGAWGAGGCALAEEGGAAARRGGGCANGVNDGNDGGAGGAGADDGGEEAGGDAERGAAAAAAGERGSGVYCADSRGDDHDGGGSGAGIDGVTRGGGVTRDGYDLPDGVRRVPVIAVLGSSERRMAHLAEPLGQWVAQCGWHLLTGGGGGVMVSASVGFALGRRSAARPGCCVGILRASTRERPEVARDGYPNDFVDTAIRTHLPASGADGTAERSRNHLNLLSASVAIVLPGGEGTASELELAKRYGVPVCTFSDRSSALVGDARADACGVPFCPSLPDVRLFVLKSIPQHLKPPPKPPALRAPVRVATAAIALKATRERRTSASVAASAPVATAPGRAPATRDARPSHAPEGPTDTEHDTRAQECAAASCSAAAGARDARCAQRSQPPSCGLPPPSLGSSDDVRPPPGGAAAHGGTRDDRARALPPPARALIRGGGARLRALAPLRAQAPGADDGASGHLASRRAARGACGGGGHGSGGARAAGHELGGGQMPRGDSALGRGGVGGAHAGSGEAERVGWNASVGPVGWAGAASSVGFGDHFEAAAATWPPAAEEGGDGGAAGAGAHASVGHGGGFGAAAASVGTVARPSPSATRLPPMGRAGAGGGAASRNAAARGHTRGAETAQQLDAARNGVACALGRGGAQRGWGGGCRTPTPVDGEAACGFGDETDGHSGSLRGRGGAGGGARELTRAHRGLRLADLRGGSRAAGALPRRSSTPAAAAGHASRPPLPGAAPRAVRAHAQGGTDASGSAAGGAVH